MKLVNKKWWQAMLSATMLVLLCSTAAIGQVLVSNTCPSQSVDLMLHVSGTVPAGTVVTWHTGTPATVANRVSNPNSVGAGTYYAAYYDATNNCFGSTSVQYVNVTINACSALTNVCPATTVNLMQQIDSSSKPANTYVGWHTGTPATAANLVSNPTAVGNGTYYASYYDPSNNCYGSTVGPVSVALTNCNTDTDGDGVTDWQEIVDGTDPNNPCSFNVLHVTLAKSAGWNNADCDGDGVTNGTEIIDGTNPLDGCSYNATHITVARSAAWNALDCDNDGLSNGAEVALGTNPLNPDTDGDGVKDGTEVADGTNPLNPCSYNAAHVTLARSTNWSNADCDGDGVTNGQEILDGTNPLDACSKNAAHVTLPVLTPCLTDTDGDGVTDAQEAIDGTNPNDPCSRVIAHITLPVTVQCCNSGSTAPCLLSSAVCIPTGSTTYDLTSIGLSCAKPANTIVEWHTSNPATSANIVGNATAVSIGQYWAIYKDTINNCYGNNGYATQQVTVTMCANNSHNTYLAACKNSQVILSYGVSQWWNWTSLASNPTGANMYWNGNNAYVVDFDNTASGLYGFVHSTAGPGTPQSDTTFITVNCTTPVTCNASWWQQPATNNCDSTLRFIVSTPSVGATYSWSFGDGATGAGDSAVHKYPASGSYTVKLVVTNGTCKDSISYNIYVSDCSVTPGGGGGTESKTLGDVIAVRLFGNAINSKTETTAYTSNNVFTHSGVIVNGTNTITLSDLVPSTVANTDAAYVTTPSDLVNFTNAVEVLAIDYTKGNTTKAVAFGTKTLGDVYSHTKPICDRLKGAELLEVKNINVNGYNLMAYKVHQRTGEIEYAMNLSAGTASNRNTISLQSNWFTNSYVADENLYNFQLWAVSYDMVKSMAADVISKLQANGSIYIPSATIADLPKAYISKGSRKATDLTVTVQNNTANTNGYFELKEKANELMSDAQITTRQIPFTVNANGTSNITIPVSDNYEGSIYVYLNNKLTDLVYLADGTWSIDYNKNNTTIQQFNIVNEAPNGQTSNSNEHRLLRNVEVAATTKDYLSIYKTMMGGGIEQNVAAYNSLLFNANTMGAGSVKITLVKKSITNWNDQYSYTVNIGDSKDFAIALNSFKSGKFNTAINANDITAVNFSFITPRNTATNMSVNLSKVRFSTATANTPASETFNVMSIYPNPTMGRFTTIFTSDVAQALVLKVTDIATGRVVKTQFISATKGANKQTIELNTNLTNGNYVVTLEGDDVKYTPAKLILAK